MFNITGGQDLTLHEVHQAAEMIGRSAHPDANILFGAVQDPAYDGKLTITVIATGFDQTESHTPSSSQRELEASLPSARGAPSPLA